MNLYNIKSEYINIAMQLTDGELTPELEQALQITEQNLHDKAINYGYVIKTIESEVDIIDAEIKRLQELKRSRSNAVEKLKTNITEAMELFGVTEVKAPTFKLSFRKSESIECDEFVDSNYCTVKTSIAPDKVAIKQAIKEGKEVIGARLVVKNNLQIK
jgi:hypothetical protein